MVIGSVTDGYNPEEATFRRTRKLLEELKDSDAEILICTKSDLVLRDLDLLQQMKKVTVSWSVNTLDETFRADMDKAVSIERRLVAMRKVYEAGIRTICFVSPIFPGITDFKAIFHEVKDICDLFWLENLNLRGSFKASIMGISNHTIPICSHFMNKSICIKTEHTGSNWSKRPRKWRRRLNVSMWIMNCLTSEVPKDIPR